MADDEDRTASLMTPAKLAQLKDRPRAAASPAAWLDQLAADAGSGHVRRLLDLRQALEAQLREYDHGALCASLQALDTALGQLDFSRLEPRGWLARATGRGRQERAEFVAEAQRGLRAGEDLRDELRALLKRRQAQGAAGERTLVEFELELKAVEKIIDQGARWLQDMRNQLKAREAQGGDPAVRQAMLEDEARCELLVARLKKLRAAGTPAQQAAERCRAAVPRRAALQQALQQLLDGECKAWQRAIGAVLEEAGEAGAVDGVEAARAAAALQAALRQAVTDCEQQQAQEQLLADAVAALREPLQAAA